MIKNNFNSKTMNIMDEINKLRHELELMYLNEKLHCSYVSESTVRCSQELDTYIVEEQRRRFDEYRMSKIKS